MARGPSALRNTALVTGAARLVATYHLMRQCGPGDDRTPRACERFLLEFYRAMGSPDGGLHVVIPKESQPALSHREIHLFAGTDGDGQAGVTMVLNAADEEGRPWTPDRLSKLIEAGDRGVFRMPRAWTNNRFVRAVRSRFWRFGDESVWLRAAGDDSAERARFAYAAMAYEDVLNTLARLKAGYEAGEGRPDVQAMGEVEGELRSPKEITELEMFAEDSDIRSEVLLWPGKRVRFEPSPQRDKLLRAIYEKARHVEIDLLPTSILLDDLEKPEGTTVTQHLCYFLHADPEGPRLTQQEVADVLGMNYRQQVANAVRKYREKDPE